MLNILSRLRFKSSTKKWLKKSPELNGTHVAILATNGFEHSELWGPMEALKNAGAIVHILSIHPGKITPWNPSGWGKSIPVDMTVREAWSMDFDALVLPGGVLNADKLRSNSEAVAFVMSLINKHRPVGAICHGIQTLIETGAIRGRKLTSSPSIKTDVENAGAHWMNKEVVVDHRIITSRGPKDLSSFTREIIREFSTGRIQHVLPDLEGMSSIM
jgi:protease I